MATVETVPQLRVQRMGKKWRIVYEASRGLARYGAKKPGTLGEPVDGGGFMDEWKDGQLEVDGQTEAHKKLSLVMSGLTAADPEEENVGL